MLQTIYKVSEIQNLLGKERKTGQKVGFVPTMGALHQGHISLIEKSLTENGVTTASIFVNPTQFNDKSDFGRYPRSVDKDARMLLDAGCRYLFLPLREKEIYPSESFKIIDFNPGTLGDVLEGAHRPGHFAGVAAVVKRLFDIIRPDNAYFGQKDFQQYLIIKKMAEDFDLPVNIILCPTLREESGLAMSSRNMLLSEEHRHEAAFLYQMLQKAKGMVLAQKASRKEILGAIQTEFEKKRNFTVDYFDICSAETLLPADDLSQSELIICVAAFLGKIRLIDNILIK